MKNLERIRPDWRTMTWGYRSAIVALALLLAASAYWVSSVVQPTTAHAADRDCSDFSTQAQAQAFYNNQDPSADPHCSRPSRRPRSAASQWERS